MECFFCKIDKPVEDFWRAAGRKRMCWDCQYAKRKAYKATYKANNPEKHREAQKRWKRGWKARNPEKYREDAKRAMAAWKAKNPGAHRKAKMLLTEWVWSLKRGPCADCGVQYNPWVMEFDHRPEFVKVESISKMVRNLISKEVILAEVAKCELVCANCHRERTAREIWGYDFKKGSISLPPPPLPL
jgi:hypothetical protein